MAGFNSINANSIKLSDKNKINNYNVIQSKAIKLTKENFKNFGKFNDNEQNFLYFCYFAEKTTSLSLKVYFLENYKRLQALNILYAGIEIEDIIPKNSLKKYKLEHFNIEQDIGIVLVEQSGKPKLYLFMAKPEEDNIIIDKSNFDNFKKNEQVIEAQHLLNAYYLILTKELNKCLKNPTTGMYLCYLNAVVECEGDVDCSYNIVFDHSKKEISMEPKQIYTNVISENEIDYYKIIISDNSIKNLVIVLMQNTGKTILRLDSFTSEIGGLDLNEEVQNSEFLPNLITISNEKLKTDNLKGIFSLTIKGLSYASYSLYYYTFNIEEDEDSLDQDKVTMKLEKGRIIRDIFMDAHSFKVYMYDSSIIGNKSNLFIGLVETDYTNLELFIFKDLNDFAIYEDRISGYLWKGDYRDYIYIDKNDQKYIDNDILYILIFKKNSYYTLKDKDKEKYNSFYLGITDENTPLLLNEGIEFKHQLNVDHPSQKFYYYFIGEEKEQDLQISLSLFYGHINAKINIENNIYNMNYAIDDSILITIKREEIYKYCKKNKNCGIEIEIKNDDSFLQYSSFLITVKSSKNAPIYLKPGIINKRTILTGEDQHFIIDIEPQPNFGARISLMFRNGQGEIYVRRVLKNEMFEINNFPDENNYEYMASYKNSINDFYLIEIPYNDFGGVSHCQLLLTVRGIFPGYFYTNIEYNIFVSSSMYNIDIDHNYRLFVSKGEIVNFHFKVGINKKRLYISMTNKDKDANMFLTNDNYISNIYQYQWRSSGGYNEYIDITINDQYFIERRMNDLDGDYYLAIQGIEDTFYNLYISSQDVKIITLAEGMPGGCMCETENDNCYFRYENINNIYMKEEKEKKIIFYTEFTYGSGAMYAKLYKNGNLEDILNSLPSQSNNDVYINDANEFLFMDINEKNPRFNKNSVIVVGVQCKQKSLFDLSAALLDNNMDVSRFSSNFIFLKYNQDNLYYLSHATGITSKFIYYINREKDLNFQIKVLYGKVNIHTYTNDTLENYVIIGKEDRNMNNNNYHHISDFELDKYTKGKNEYYGKVLKQYGNKNYFYIEVKPILDCLININVNYDDEIIKIPLNKEILGIINNYEYNAYYDFDKDIEEAIITITSLDKSKIFDVYLKTNIINNNEDNDQENKYSKASSQNYDIKGRTNELTSAISLRIKNAPKTMRTEFNTIRILINIDSIYYSNDCKIKILITPIINNVTRMNPEQNIYYFSGFEKKYTDKTIFNLKNINIEDDLMIIEISSCKGDFLYSITDIPPLDTETYNVLQEKKIMSRSYSSNGKTIITVDDIKLKEYYLTLFGSNNRPEMDLYINEKDEKDNNNVDVLFYFFTTNKKNYNYLITNDSLIYETKDNYYSLIITIPEIKERDAFGKEKYVNSMNYTLIVSDQNKDYIYMESTCYLTKLKQSNQNSKFKYLEINFDKKNNAFNIKGFKTGKVYYMNILGLNEKTGQTITYKPLMIISSSASRNLKIFIIVFLIIVMVVFLYVAFTFYRKYRLKRLQLAFVEENISDGNPIERKIRNLNKINLDFIKENDNDKETDNIINSS